MASDSRNTTSWAARAGLGLIATVASAEATDLNGAPAPIKVPPPKVVMQEAPIDPAARRDVNDLMKELETARKKLKDARDSEPLPVDPKRINTFIRELGDDDFRTREKATAALITIGTPAMPEVAKAENDADLERAKRAQGITATLKRRIPYQIEKVTGIGQKGSAALDAVALLTTMVKEEPNEEFTPHENEELTIQSMVALGKIGAKAAPAVPELVVKLKDKSAAVRLASTEALGKIGPKAKDAVIPLLDVLDKDSDVKNKKAAALSLGSLRSDAKKVVPALGKALKDKDLIEAAVNALGQFGPDAETEIPGLLAVLKDKDIESWLRSAAVSALENIGLKENGATPAVTKKAAAAVEEALKDESNYTRQSAVVTLGRFGPDAADSVPALIAAFKKEPGNNGYPFVKADMLKALVSIGIREKGVMDTLKEALGDAEDDTRAAAAQVAGHLGKDAEALVPALVDLVKQDTAYTSRGQVRRLAMEALSNLGGLTEVPPQLAGLLKGTELEPYEKAQVMEILGQFGPKAAKAVPALGKALMDDNSTLSDAALGALEKIGPDVDGVIPALREAALNGKPIVLREGTAGKLGNMGQTAKTAASRRAAVDTLIEVLDDPAFQVQTAAARALREYGKDAKKALPALNKLVQSDISELRQAAADAAREIESVLKRDGR